MAEVKYNSYDDSPPPPPPPPTPGPREVPIDKNLPWFDATGKADGPLAKKFLVNYLTGIQSDLKRPDNAKLFDFIKTSLAANVQGALDRAPPFAITIGLVLGKTLHDSIQVQTFIPNLIANIKDLSNADDLGIIAGIPLGLTNDRTGAKRKLQEMLKYTIKPNGLPDNIADLLVPLLLNNAETALLTVTPAAPWSPSTGYPVGSRAVNKGVTYEKMLPPTSPSANTAGTVWKKVASGASRGGRRTRGKKARKGSRR